jgi:hypothetical protein
LKVALYVVVTLCVTFWGRFLVGCVKRTMMSCFGAFHAPYTLTRSVRSALAAYRTLPSTSRFFLSSLFRSVTRVSVVSIRPEMLAAFCRAVRTTFSGSMMPALNMSTYLPLLAS